MAWGWLCNLQGHRLHKRQSWDSKLTQVCFGKPKKKKCLTLCNPTDCSLPGFSVHEILQASILEWVAISCSRGSLQPRDHIWVSCTAGGYLYRLSQGISQRQCSGNCDNYAKNQVFREQRDEITHLCTLGSQEVVLQDFDCILF